MIKMRNAISLFVLGILLLSAVSATNPWSASPTGAEKNTYSSLDDVFIESGIICQPAKEVDLYIVDNNDDWQDGDVLDDVRGAPELIVLISSKIPRRAYWKSPDAGEYDIVIDCDRDGEYNFGDAVDDFGNIGFKVESVAGTGEAKRGAKDPGDHIWQYDTEELDLLNEMLQVALLARGEDIELLNITLAASGNGDDTKIIALEVYVDENKNGKVDDTDILIGDVQPAFEDNNGEVVVSLDYFLEKDFEENILIVYTMEDSVQEGEFVLEAKSINGEGGDSDSVIKFSGLPLKSGTKKVLPEKTCLGELTLDLSPNPAEPNQKVIAKADGLTGCDGKEVSLRTNPCGSSSPKIIKTCILDGGTCDLDFKDDITRTYYLCIDKNGDGDTVDFGEFAFEELLIQKPEEKPVVNETEEEEGELNETVTEEEEKEQEKTNVTPTGAAGALEEITEAGSFFILLEVTLLLILFVLVMILFRLKPAPAPPQEIEKEKAEEKKEKGKEKREKKEKE